VTVCLIGICTLPAAAVPLAEMPYRPHKIMSSFIADGALGEGIAMWMRFLRNMSLLFLLLFLLNLPAMLFYMHGNGLSDAAGKQAQGNGVLALPSLGNLFVSQQVPLRLPPPLFVSCDCHYAA